MKSAEEAYRKLITELREIALLSSVGSVLGWDERTQLPPKGTAHRALQSSLLARLVHERVTSPTIEEYLSIVEGSDLVADPLSDAAVNVRETRRSYDREKKLPTKLVEELSETSVLAQQAWGDARARSSYPQFRPWLEKILHLKRQEANCVGYASDPYDALLDEFEPGETTTGILRVFESLRAPLVDLVGRVMSSGRTAPVSILEQSFPAAGQETLARDAAKAVGFDFAAGRLDVSLHPFCTDLGPGDTRMTTRYDPGYFGESLFGVLHETGHALYNQGLDREHYGTPRGQYVSLGIHESQSRMWENFVGRSRAFWKWFLPITRQTFPSQLQNVNDEQWYFAVNDIRPSLIRTEADEATYNLHVLLRFELERALIREELSPAELPSAWNQKVKQYFGITPPDDAKGCLQDIHWSGGAFGYFPTYTLGNLYAAQFFEQARHDLSDLDGMFARGEFAPLLQWLRTNIHREGKRYSGPNLVRKITGTPLSAEPLLRHLRTKVVDLYGV